VGGQRVVVAGASLAGLRAAEELRSEGFDGTITMVGDEPHRPYDRPPLSKQVLSGRQPPEATELSVATGTVDDLTLEWRLGEVVTGLDQGARRVLLAGGEALAYDGLVIATGASPRRLPGTDHLAGVHTLRTLDDCTALRADLEGGARRVAVVGAGFIGAEVVATCRGLGLDVTLIEALPVPMERALGADVGNLMAEIHREHGVDVRLAVGVVRIEGGDRVERVLLTDGTTLDVDVVLVGIGVTPNTEWLADSGLALDDGVLCDASCLAGAGIVAAGDVARWPNRRFDEVMRVEHWDNAIAMGAHAGRTLFAHLAGRTGEPFEPVPWFWSDQYDRKIQLAGRTEPGEPVTVVSGSFEERRFVALYRRDHRLVGVLGMNQPAKVMRWRTLVEAATPWEDALLAAKEMA